MPHSQFVRVRLENGTEQLVTARLAKILSLTVVDEQAPDSASAVSYTDRKVPELKAEIASRNEGRAEADLIPSDGKKADLVAALEADDGK